MTTTSTSTAPADTLTRAEVSERFGVKLGQVDYMVRLGYLQSVGKKAIGPTAHRYPAYRTCDVTAALGRISVSKGRINGRTEDRAAVAEKKANPVMPDLPEMPPTGSAIMDAVNAGKAHPVMRRDGFFLTFRRHPDVWRAARLDESPEVGESRIVEYRQSILYFPLWEALPVPAAGRAGHVLADKLDLLERITHEAAVKAIRGKA